LLTCVTWPFLTETSFSFLQQPFKAKLSLIQNNQNISKKITTHSVGLFGKTACSTIQAHSIIKPFRVLYQRAVHLTFLDSFYQNLARNCQLSIKWELGLDYRCFWAQLYILSLILCDKCTVIKLITGSEYRLLQVEKLSLQANTSYSTIGQRIIFPIIHVPRKHATKLIRRPIMTSILMADHDINLLNKQIIYRYYKFMFHDINGKIISLNQSWKSTTDT
jgi:hypothetical protein